MQLLFGLYAVGLIHVGLDRVCFTLGSFFLSLSIFSVVWRFGDVIDIDFAVRGWWLYFDSRHWLAGDRNVTI